MWQTRPEHRLATVHPDTITKVGIAPEQLAITKPGRRVSIDMSRHGVAEILAGGVVLAIALGFMVYAVAHSGRSTGTGYTLQARFDHIDGLSVGGDVRIAGVKVGTVTDERIDPKSFRPSLP